MFTLGLRRQLAGTPVTVVESYPPLLDTDLTPDGKVPGKERFGAEAIDRWARVSVDGILAGELNVYPKSGTDFIPDLVGRTEAIADTINQRVARSEDWEERVKQRMAARPTPR